MRTYLKWLLIIGFVAVGLLFFLNKGNCQEISHDKLLTEMSVDIRYIRKSIGEMRDDYKIMTSRIAELDTRVTRVEDKTSVIEKTLYNIAERNNWYLGLFGILVGGMLLFQYKRSYAFRNNNGKNINKTN